MTIFVSIASYRDPELVPTLRDLLAKATAPDALRVCVCDQYGPETETLPEDLASDPRIERIAIPWEQSQGACWARALIMSHYRGETHFLQLDSHHRFVAGWDTILQEELAATGREKALLTGYVNSYRPGEPLDAAEGPLELHFDAFHRDGIAVFRPVPMGARAQAGRPTRARFISGHFLFAPGRFVEEVPYDPALYFIGEEISLSVRAFMEGWYLFHPSRVVLFHEYTREYRSHKHWADHREGAVAQPWWTRDAASRAAVAALLHDRSRRGSVRSLREYEDYAGLCFARQRVHPETLLESEPPTRVEADWQAQGQRYCFSVGIPLALLAEAEAARHWTLQVWDDAGRLLYRRDLYPPDLEARVQGGETLRLPIALDAATAPAQWSMRAAADPDGLSSVRGEIHVTDPEPRLTCVTALLDLGREALAQPRPYAEYRAHLAALLAAPWSPAVRWVVFCAPEDAAWVQATCPEALALEVRPLTRADLLALPGATQVEALRQDAAWRAQAPWLGESPQAALSGYALLVMHKLALLAQVAQGCADDERVCWLDAGLTRTVRPDQVPWLLHALPPETLRLFAYPYPTDTAEIHGFARAGLRRFAGREVHRVLRGGCLGGAPRVIEAAEAAYEVLRRESLAAGFLGTEESLLSILHARGEPAFAGVVEIGEDGLIPSAPCGRPPWRPALPEVPDRIALVGALRALAALDRTGGPAHVEIGGASAWEQATLLAPWLHTGDVLTILDDPRPRAPTMAFVQEGDRDRALASLVPAAAPLGARRLVQVGTPRPLPPANAGERGALYILTFNAPRQLAAWIARAHVAAPDLLRLEHRVVIDNSTDPGVKADYDALCAQHGFTRLCLDNAGITGGRLAATRHFLDQTDAEQMWYFEDDMLWSDADGVCRNGWRRSLPDAVAVIRQIVAHEDRLDLLKLCYSEHFGCHQLDWAWVNSPPEARRTAFAQGSTTTIRAIRSSRGIAWALGDVHYSHWPAVLTRRGARLLCDGEPPDSETAMMLHAHRLQRAGELACGVLLASPIQHHRVEGYADGLRRES